MAQQVSLVIDDTPVTVEAGSTLLEAAQRAGIAIPTLCVHTATTANALCRLCVVEVEGARLLQPACVAPAAEGMVVRTCSERVLRSRRTILEMLAASIDLAEAPQIRQQMDELHANAQRFPDARRRQPALRDDNPMFVRDYAKCVLCWRCVQVCADDAQYAFAINFSGRGYATQIATFFQQSLPASTCVFCGQCVGVCPTNALKPKREWLLDAGSPPETINQLAGGKRRKRRAHDDE